MANDQELALSIDTTGAYPRAVLENSVFRAVMRTNAGGACGVEHAIRDWIIKRVDEDQVDNYIDACAHRGPMAQATVVHDGTDRKTLRAEFEDCPKSSHDNSAVSEYTVFPDSPVIRVDYLRYPSSWANTVDIGTPGGSRAGRFRFCGGEEYERDLRGFVGYPDSYWNTFDGGDYADDPTDGGPLNYNGHMIMAVGNPSNGRGFGRIMPIFKNGVEGGMRIVKLLFSRGFETFPRTGQRFAPSYTGYLFVFQNGLDDAIRMGQAIVDGDMLIGRTDGQPTPVAPSGYALIGNHPNPFNPTTTIVYELPEASEVTLTVHLATGHLVDTLISQRQVAGRHEVVWDGRGYAGGVYFCRLEAGGFEETKRMVLLK